MDFTGKIALITGSGSGIGRAIAIRLAQGGADVAINYFRNRQPAVETRSTIESLGQRAIVLGANIGDIDELNGLIDQTVDQLGGIDILVCSAASGYNRPVLKQRPKGWDWTMNINARSALFAAQRAAPIMERRGGGAIVNISSPGATRVLPDYVVVGASKAALESLTRYLAIELAPLGIQVNAVSPGVVPTGALQHFAISEDPELLERARVATPAGRLATPEDIAEIVAFLCGPSAEMIRGQVILADGGYSLPITSGPVN
jgi:enoyl-[acyl-carrier protein] reductase III